MCPDDSVDTGLLVSVSLYDSVDMVNWSLCPDDSVDMVLWSVCPNDSVDTVYWSLCPDTV